MAMLQTFGYMEGKEIQSVLLQRGKMYAELLTLGATLRSLTVPDRNGEPVDICLGYDTAEEYLSQSGYLGAVVGRCANRIAHSRFTLGGKTYCLTPNEGENHLHGGKEGFNRKLWHIVRHDSCSVTFSLESPEGEEGYPGAVHAEVTYTLTESGGLELCYRAVSDQDTLLNLTNHSYFNLAGHQSGPVGEQLLELFAARYTPCGPGNIPTGELAPTEGTPLDFARPTALGARWDDSFLAATGGYDHNYALDGAPLAARLYSPATGIGMEVSTTLPGLQLYSGNYLTERAGKGGARYAKHHGVCLETHCFPDAVHHANFPSPVLRAGESYESRTLYRFSIR